MYDFPRINMFEMKSELYALPILLLYNSLTFFMSRATINGKLMSKILLITEILIPTTGILT